MLRIDFILAFTMEAIIFSVFCMIRSYLKSELLNYIKTASKYIYVCINGNRFTIFLK